MQDWSVSEIVVREHPNVRNIERYDYITRVLGAQASLVDSYVLRRAADGFYADTIDRYASEIDTLARLLAENNVVVSRLGRGGYLASRVREYKKSLDDEG